VWDTPAVHNCCYKCFLEQVRVVTTTSWANITRLRCKDGRMAKRRQHSTQSGVPFHQYCMPFCLLGQWMAFNHHQPKLLFYLFSLSSDGIVQIVWLSHDGFTWNSSISHWAVHDPIPLFTTLKSHKMHETTIQELWLHLQHHFFHLYACAKST